MDKCELCRCKDQDEIKYGEFLQNNGIGVHTYCLYLSSNLVQRGAEDEGILCFLTDDIKQEAKRVKLLKCGFCSKPYANIGCCERKCNRTFHLTCGIKNGRIENQFGGTYNSFCQQHSRKDVEYKPKDDEKCCICFDKLIDEKQFNVITMLLAPCCKNGWFHKWCLQGCAKAAGYFFKCPLCNNKDEFCEKILKLGIFIPQRDASWELEPNAFAELLERPNACSAEICENRRGRHHDSIHNSLVYCSLCGSAAIHELCRPKIGRQTAFTCNDCAIAVGIAITGIGQQERSTNSDNNECHGQNNDSSDIDVCASSRRSSSIEEIPLAQLRSALTNSENGNSLEVCVSSSRSSSIEEIPLARLRSRQKKSEKCRQFEGSDSSSSNSNDKFLKRRTASKRYRIESSSESESEECNDDVLNNFRNSFTETHHAEMAIKESRSIEEKSHVEDNLSDFSTQNYCKENDSTSDDNNLHILPNSTKGFSELQKTLTANVQHSINGKPSNDRNIENCNEVGTNTLNCSMRAENKQKFEESDDDIDILQEFEKCLARIRKQTANEPQQSESDNEKKNTVGFMSSNSSNSSALEKEDNTNNNTNSARKVVLAPSSSSEASGNNEMFDESCIAKRTRRKSRSINSNDEKKNFEVSCIARRTRRKLTMNSSNSSCNESSAQHNGWNGLRNDQRTARDPYFGRDRISPKITCTVTTTKNSNLNNGNYDNTNAESAKPEFANKNGYGWITNRTHRKLIVSPYSSESSNDSQHHHGNDRVPLNHDSGINMQSFQNASKIVGTGQGPGNSCATGCANFSHSECLKTDINCKTKRTCSDNRSQINVQHDNSYHSNDSVLNKLNDFDKSSGLNSSFNDCNSNCNNVNTSSTSKNSDNMINHNPFDLSCVANRTRFRRCLKRESPLLTQSKASKNDDYDSKNAKCSRGNFAKSYGLLIGDVSSSNCPN